MTTFLVGEKTENEARVGIVGVFLLTNIFWL